MPRTKQISIDVEVNRIIESNRNTFSESENDILRRLLVIPAAQTHASVKAPDRLPQDTRRRGAWSVQITGEEFQATNMKNAYCIMLRELANLDSNFLIEFSKQKSRSRRFVAREAMSLYQSSPDLAKDYAAELVPGWYVDTNLSQQQVKKRAQAAAEVAGLKYGTEVTISVNDRNI